MSTSSSHLWQRPPGRLLRFAVPIAAVVGIAAAIAGALVPSAGRLALVPALFLLLFVPVAARFSRQIERRFRETARLAYLDELTELEALRHVLLAVSNQADVDSTVDHAALLAKQDFTSAAQPIDPMSECVPPWCRSR